MTTVSHLQVRQNYYQGLEAAINCQINPKLYASYVHLSMSCYFDQDDVVLRNFVQILSPPVSGGEGTRCETYEAAERMRQPNFPAGYQETRR
ncbi:Ferritin heavy chain [Lemmus lemmus]